MASSVETVRDSLDRAKKSYEENEALRDRIERILNKVKIFTNRKRQELNQSLDSGYGSSIDLGRRSIEMKVKETEIFLFVILKFKRIFSRVLSKMLI